MAVGNSQNPSEAYRCCLFAICFYLYKVLETVIRDGCNPVFSIQSIVHSPNPVPECQPIDSMREVSVDLAKLEMSVTHTRQFD